MQVGIKGSKAWNLWEFVAYLRGDLYDPYHPWDWEYLPTWMVDLYGFHVGKYTRPMDPMGDLSGDLYEYMSIYAEEF